MRLLVVIISIFSFQLVSAQKDVLFTYADEKVTMDEFKYFYNKTNPNGVKYDTASVNEYLNLYINFRIRVKEAENLRIDTSLSVKRELFQFITQLQKSYEEKEVLPGLLTEAHLRMQKDRRVSHILYKVEANASPEDTLAAYKKAIEAKKKLIRRGAKFADFAKGNSDDKRAETNGGDLGFISAFSVPYYNFESAAYNTPVGGIAGPIRTRLGYHLIKVTEEREALGQTQVAHIYISTGKNPTLAQINDAKAKIDKIYASIMEGASFDELVSVQSDDKMNKQSGGILEPFTTGQVEFAFEKAAYDLKTDGEISQPVQTSSGWHILKRISRTPIQPLENQKEGLKKVILKNSRFDIAKEKLASSYKVIYGLVEYPDRMNEVYKLVDSTFGKGNWKSKIRSTKELFSIGDKSYTMADFGKFMELTQVRRPFESKVKLIDIAYESFLNDRLLDYGISKKYPEYVRLKEEYRNGILLYDLLQKEVWTKASTDTAGLKKFYETNKFNYMWQPRIDVEVFTVTGEKTAKKMAKLLSKKDASEVMKKMNKDPKNIMAHRDNKIVEKGEDPILDSLNWKKGHVEIKNRTANSYTIYLVNSILDPSPKELNKIKGYHVADYQDYLEKQWIDHLRAKYSVNVNDSMVSKLYLQD